MTDDPRTIVPFEQVVLIDYTTWRGERRLRKILPERIWFGSTEWHPEPQWLLEAVDLEDRGKYRKSFALSSIQSWQLLMSQVVSSPPPTPAPQ